LNQTKYLFRSRCARLRVERDRHGGNGRAVEMLKAMGWFMRAQVERACHRQTWLFDLARNLRRIIDCDRTSLLATNLQGCQKLDDLHHALATRAMPDRRFGGC
jgi:hypothetical protein